MAVKAVQVSNRAVAPGELLREEIDVRGISAAALADGMGITVEGLAEVFGGERAVTPKMALALEGFLGGPASLWLNMEASYRVTLAGNFEVYGDADPFGESDGGS